MSDDFDPQKDINRYLSQQGRTPPSHFDWQTWRKIGQPGAYQAPPGVGSKWQGIRSGAGGPSYAAGATHWNMFQDTGQAVGQLVGAGIDWASGKMLKKFSRSGESDKGNGSGGASASMAGSKDMAGDRSQQASITQPANSRGLLRGSRKGANFSNVTQSYGITMNQGSDVYGDNYGQVMGGVSGTVNAPFQSGNVAPTVSTGPNWNVPAPQNTPAPQSSWPRPTPPPPPPPTGGTPPPPPAGPAPTQSRAKTVPSQSAPLSSAGTTPDDGNWNIGLPLAAYPQQQPVGPQQPVQGPRAIGPASQPLAIEGPKTPAAGAPLPTQYQAMGRSYPQPPAGGGLPAQFGRMGPALPAQYQSMTKTSPQPPAGGGMPAQYTSPMFRPSEASRRLSPGAYNSRLPAPSWTHPVTGEVFTAPHPYDALRGK